MGAAGGRDGYCRVKGQNEAKSIWLLEDDVWLGSRLPAESSQARAQARVLQLKELRLL
jgi:hypothetical protein